MLQDRRLQVVKLRAQTAYAAGSVETLSTKLGSSSGDVRTKTWVELLPQC